MKNFLLLFLLTFFYAGAMEAQRRCGHVEYMEQLYQEKPTLRKKNEEMNQLISRQLLDQKQMKTSAVQSEEIIYYIPVVVHVIYNNYVGGVTNIPDERIYSQIDILNQDYGRTNADTNLTYDLYKSIAANVKIQFCLASTDPNGEATNGIVRVFNQKTAFDLNEAAALKKLSYWPSDQYLNLWICNLGRDQMGYEILGYAQFPDQT